MRGYHKNYAIKEDVVAITLDDGPNKEFTLKALELLKKHNAKATFFCIGKNIDKHPKIFQQIIMDGHIVGNHSYRHSNNYGFLSTEKIIEDIEHTQQIAKEYANLELKLFRPPFGVTNPNIARAVKLVRLDTIGWSIRSYDTIAKSSEKVFHKITKNIQKGDVILLHDTSQQSIDVLEQLLMFLNKNKIKTTTLDELFNIKAYA